ncbi:hypothetical protein [Alloactinosynnema sp. L-07]|uniref:hypothetical protein n=1 Tax=Alloactinosynnema sp. L-07 TaxID=1653480 RepID=UPI00065EFF38|nr:hypothetical protein [Alloactinosynnema sp. L-07]CRK56200.1 hypothetical protein [Alloactinosynnema sp. L-07]
MSSVLEKVNASAVFADIPLRADVPMTVGAASPVLATPATIVGIAAGVAVVAGVAGAFYAGYQIGRAIGHQNPLPQ